MIEYDTDCMLYQYLTLPSNLLQTYIAYQVLPSEPFLLWQSETNWIGDIDHHREISRDLN